MSCTIYTHMNTHFKVYFVDEFAFCFQSMSLKVKWIKLYLEKEDGRGPYSVFTPCTYVIRFWHWTILLSWSIVCSAKLQTFCKVKFLVLKLFSDHIFPNSHHYLISYQSVLKNSRVTVLCQLTQRGDVSFSCFWWFLMLEVRAVRSILFVCFADISKSFMSACSSLTPTKTSIASSQTVGRKTVLWKAMSSLSSLFTVQ